MKRWLALLGGLAFVFSLTAGVRAQEAGKAAEAKAVKCPTCQAELVKAAPEKDIKSFKKDAKCPSCGMDVVRSDDEKDVLVCDKCETTFKLCDKCAVPQS